MEHQKIINLLDDTQKEPSKFRRRYWVEINDESGRTYRDSYQIKRKTSLIRSNLCNYSDDYLLVSGTIIIPGVGAGDAAQRANERNKGVIIKLYWMHK